MRLDIASSAYALASKFMKLTTLFLQLRKLRKKWTNYKYFWDYDTDFSQWNFISVRKGNLKATLLEFQPVDFVPFLWKFNLSRNLKAKR